MQKIQSLQKNLRNELEERIYLEFYEDNPEIDRKEIEKIFLFMLDAHIDLVNENLSSFPFVIENNNFLVNAQCTQLITCLLCLFCSSKTLPSGVLGMGERLFHQIQGIALYYYEICAENNLEDYLADSEEFKLLVGIVGNTNHDQVKEQLNMSKEDFLIKLLGSKPYNLPRNYTLGLLNISTEINMKWMIMLSELSA